MTTYTYDIGEVNQEGLDRNLELPCSTLFKLFQSARMRLPWIGAAYEDFRNEQPEDPHRRLVVKSQGLSLTEAGICTTPLHKSVRTKVLLADVGTTSIEFRYHVYYDNILVARGCAVMVSVTGPPGSLKPTPVPRRVADLAPSARASSYLMASKPSLRNVLQPLSNIRPDFNPLTFETTFVVRFSDEDANKHANHTFLIRLVEDTLACARATKGEVSALAKFFIYNTLRGIAMTYMHEAHAMDVVRIRLIERPNEDGELDEDGNTGSGSTTDDDKKSEIEFDVVVCKILRAVKGTVADTILARGVVVLAMPKDESSDAGRL